MALTTIPGAGQRLRGSVLSALITEVRPVLARKTSNQTVNNSATLVDDTALVISLAASATYRIALDLIWSSGTTPDFKFDWVIPSGGTGAWTVGAVVGAAEYHGSLTWATFAGMDGTGGVLFTRCEGVLTTTNAGTLQLRWAQGTATASDTIVYAHSLLTAYRQS